MNEQSHPSCLNVVADLLKRCESNDNVCPPTDLYNEGWLLRIILDWFSRQKPSSHELSFSQGCIWFSEALLPSQFLARFRGDPLSESWTHADGIIGHIRIGRDGKADTTTGLSKSPRQAHDSPKEPVPPLAAGQPDTRHALTERSTTRKGPRRKTP